MGNPWTPGLPFAMQPWNKSKAQKGTLPSDASLPSIPRPTERYDEPVDEPIYLTGGGISASTRQPTDQERFDRMKNAKDTLDLPTSPKDMKRIQAIERAKNAKQ